VFLNPRINALANYIHTAGAVQYESIPKAGAKPYYKLSPTQERMYILHQLNPKGIGYNMPMVLPLGQNASYERLVSVFSRLIARHESLRTSFVLQGDEPVQQIHETIDFSIDRLRVSEQEFEALQQVFVQPFELDKAPLLRLAYVEVDDGGRFLLADMHHIITDGVSQTILEQEFNALYAEQELHALPLQYKDYAEWINSEPQQQRIKAQEQYWLETFAGELSTPELPYDYRRQAQRNFQGWSLQLDLGVSEHAALQQFCQQQGVTLYMFLLSAINIWLSKLSGEHDIVVLSPIAARRHEDLEKIIGLFINTLALRTYPAGETTYSTRNMDLKRWLTSCSLTAT
jgi:hypothetical protein